MAVLSVLLLFFFNKELAENDKTNTGICTPKCLESYLAMNLTTMQSNYSFYHESSMSQREDDNSFHWRIVGGKLVAIDDVPYQVMYGKNCSGALIAPRWVITAAHCKDSEQYVYVGSAYRSKAKPYRICAHFLHPNWSRPENLISKDYDYQLVLLESAVQVTDQTRPIAIGQVEDIRMGVNVAVSGWGQLKTEESKGMRERLRKVFVPVMLEAVCRLLLPGRQNEITPRKFCAGYVNGTKNACEGDSGGPVVVNGRLVGLVSSGVGCGGGWRPFSVYSNVPLARDWIRSITGLPL